MINLFGIPNCDTVRKVRRVLDDNGVAYRFHDYKKEGVDAARLANWAAKAGWEKLLNRAGTTFRQLPLAEKEAIDEAKALQLMVAHPSLIKRPVIEHDRGLIVGNDTAAIAALK